MSNFFGLEKHAKLFLRVGLAFAFLWFGFKTLTNPEMFQSLVPAWTASFIGTLTLLKIHGAFELIFGFLLLIGYKTKIVSGLLLLSLLATIFSLSYGPVMIRDITIALALFSVFLESLHPSGQNSA